MIFYEYKRCDPGAPHEKRPVAGRAGGEGLCDPAVSRWETGETVPNTETLKLLSRFFDVSINTLLGAPRQLICQCCGMPLEDGNMSREPDGSFNEDYCKWCYTDGAFTYQSMDALIDFCAAHMANDAFPPVRVRAYLQDLLPKLKHWQIAENK